ncbi:hypothetical protein B0H14DRAFT_2623408 [Mycena olivaceomarginata]|nr:hypothetical protein B0H14DRAFT_2623408 [Mycena olivaceomarginata]
MASSFTNENIDGGIQPILPDERQAHVYAGVLQVLDLAKKNDKDTRRIVGYVCAFVFSPTTVCYRDINVSKHILKAMHECNVKNLLQEDDIIAVGLVLTLIHSKGTHYRNTFKTKVCVPLLLQMHVSYLRFRCFNTIYEDDKVEYGKPEDTDLTTVDFSTTPDWQVTLGERTKNIQPQLVSKKHKIGEVEDDNDESDE